MRKITPRGEFGLHVVAIDELAFYMRGGKRDERTELTEALRDLVATRRAATNRRTTLIPVPAAGPLRALDAGYHLCPGHARGHLTWQQWLRSDEPAR